MEGVARNPLHKNLASRRRAIATTCPEPAGREGHRYAVLRNDGTG